MESIARIRERGASFFEDRGDFKTNSKEFDLLCERLKNLDSEKDEYFKSELFFYEVKRYFDKKNQAYNRLKQVMSPNDINLFIDLNYDILKICAMIEPYRHKNSYVQYSPNTQTTRKVSLLEYEILETIAGQFKSIAEINGNTKLAQIQDISKIFDFKERKTFWQKLRAFWHK